MKWWENFTHYDANKQEAGRVSECIIKCTRIIRRRPFISHKFVSCLSYMYLYKGAKYFIFAPRCFSKRRQSAWRMFAELTYLWKCSLIRSSRVLSGKFATQRCRVSRTILHQLIRIHGGGLHARSFRARHSRNLFFSSSRTFYLLLIFLVTKFRIDNFFFCCYLNWRDRLSLSRYFSYFLARQNFSLWIFFNMLQHE
jgi:hypothetical protein